MLGRHIFPFIKGKASQNSFQKSQLEEDLLNGTKQRTCKWDGGRVLSWTELMIRPSAGIKWKEQRGWHEFIFPCRLSRKLEKERSIQAQIMACHLDQSAIMAHCPEICWLTKTFMLMPAAEAQTTNKTDKFIWHICRGLFKTFSK